MIRFPLSLLLLPCLATALRGAPHHPHDVVNAFALSPAYPQDRTLLVSADGSFTPFLRSGNGGYSFTMARSGLLGAVARQLAFAPDWETSGRVWVAQGEAGLQGSRDRARTWEPPTTDHEAWTLALAPTAPDGTQPLFYAERRRRVFRSDDGGRTARELQVAGLGRGVIHGLAVSPAFGTDGTVAVAADAGLFWSTDGGGTFQALPLDGVPRRVAFSPQYGQDGTVWVATHGAGAWRSTDRGGTFAPCGELPEADVNDLVVSPAWPRDPTLFACTPVEGVFESPDGGGSWRRVPLQVELTFQTEDHYRSLQLSPGFPRDPTLVVGTYEGLFLSHDRGRSWREANLSPTRMGRKVRLSPDYARDGTVLASGYGMQLMVSTDRGGSWDRRCVEIQAQSGYALAPSPDFPRDQLVMIGANHGLRRSTDAGRTWERIDLPVHTPRDRESSYEIRAIAYSPEFARDRTVFALHKGGLYRSEDAGRTWTAGPPPPCSYAARLALSPEFPRDRTLFAAGTDLRRSEDGGATFGEALLEWSVKGLVCAPDFAATGEVYCFSEEEGVHWSADRGATWTSVVLDGGYQPCSLRLSPGFAADGTMFVGTSGGGLFRSSDRGRSFQRVGDLGGPADHVISLDVTAGPDHERTLFIGTYDGIWRSVDGGASWTLTTSEELYDEARDPWQARGDWRALRYPGALSRGVSVSRTPGDVMTLPFTGAGLRLFGSRGPDHGLAEVFVDGTLVATVDGYHPEQGARVLMYEDPELPWGYHAVSVRVTGRTAGDASDCRVGVDGAEVAYRGPEDVVPVFAPDVPLPPLPGVARAATDRAGGGGPAVEERTSQWWYLVPVVLALGLWLRLGRRRRQGSPEQHPG